MSINVLNRWGANMPQKMAFAKITAVYVKVLLWKDDMSERPI